MTSGSQAPGTYTLDVETDPRSGEQWVTVVAFEDPARPIHGAGGLVSPGKDGPA